MGAMSGGLAVPLPDKTRAPVVNDVDRLTLRESILRAFGRSPEIARQAAQVGVGQAQIDEAKSVWYPQVGLTGNVGHSRQYDSSGSLDNAMSYGITITQLIYDFGKTSSNIKQQTSIRDNYRFKLMSSMSVVAEDTALAYVEVKRYQALIDAVQKNIVSLEGVYQMARLRAEAGLNSSSDELQAQTRIAGMRSTLEQYLAQLQMHQAKLAVLTGAQASRFADIPPGLAEQPVSLDNIDYSMVPAVLAAESQQQSAEYGVDKARSEYWPTLSLQGAKTRNQTRNDAYWNDQLQLNVDVPLYQGGAVSSRVRQAEGSRQMAVTQVDQAKLDVLQKASVALASWSGARGREQAGGMQFASASQTRDVYKNEYKLGKRSLNDLLSVEQDVFQAQSAEITANYDSWSAAVNYAAAVNNLLPLSGINIGPANGLPELK
ncbi:TolC family outer membrane protein [Enterobacillus tribolii]|nr:transporter [Enterobacillus tribolii]